MRTQSHSAPDRVLVLIFGDHGMTADGNHGGATADETQSALLVYSTTPLGVRVTSARDDASEDDGSDSNAEEEAARSMHVGSNAEAQGEANGSMGGADEQQRWAGEDETPAHEGSDDHIDSIDGGGDWLVSERALNAYASVPIADDQWYANQIKAAQRSAHAAAARHPNRMASRTAASSVAAASAAAPSSSNASSSLSSASSSASSSPPARDVAADIRAAHAKAARIRALFERDERRHTRMVDQVRKHINLLLLSSPRICIRFLQCFALCLPDLY